MDCPPILMLWSVTEDSSLGGAAAGSVGFSAGLDSFSCANEFAWAKAKREAAAHSRVRRVAGFILKFLLESGNAAYCVSTHSSSFWVAAGLRSRGIRL